MRVRTTLATSVAFLALLLPHATMAARAPMIDIDSFLTGLACNESSGRFDAVNPRTGAFGKYQVMPRNWPVWAGRYLGNPWAPKSPVNQEFVVRQRIEQLRANHRTWRNVAHWWLTGNVHDDPTAWSPQAASYVRRVMQARASSSGLGSVDPHPQTLPAPRRAYAARPNRALHAPADHRWRG